MKKILNFRNIKFRPTSKSVEDDALAVSHARIIICLAFICFAYLVLIIRLFDISLSSREDIKISSAANKSIDGNFYIQRAGIVDRNGNLLAVNIPTASLYADPRKITDKDTTAKKLCGLFAKHDCNLLKNNLNSDKTFIWIKRHLTPKEQQQLHNLGLPGLAFIRDEKRVYPHGNLFSHILGYVDIDGNGIAGIECYFNDKLNAEPDKRLTLSVDSRVQQVLRDEILHQIKNHNAIGGSGIVMNVKNGEILAMVSLPDFDPHQPSKATDRQRFNQATLGTYEMGSTFKLLTAAMGIDSRYISVNDSFNTDAVIKIGNKQISNYRGHGGILSVPEILMYSSNIGTAQIAMKIGTKQQRKYLETLGLLSTSEIELPEKASPLYPPKKLWTQASLITISYGHGISETPLHLARAFGAIVNDGNLIKPTLLKVLNTDKVEYTNVISSKSSMTMKKLLRLVVTDGFGRKANAEGYLVGGKTGTAEKINGRSYNKKANIASFIGAFPIDDPEYAVLVLIDEATPNSANAGFTTGGMLAAPVAGSVISQIGPILGVKPRDPEDPAIKEKLHLDFTPRKKLNK
jgi:cell division protein FtsI (penicillin-binding protein 3)